MRSIVVLDFPDRVKMIRELDKKGERGVNPTDKDLSADDEKSLHDAIKDWKKNGSF